MEQREDAIVDISEHLERFFGCSGKMLKPSRATIEALIHQIPERALITTDLLRKKLAAQFDVQVTCPYDTKQVLREIANDAGSGVAYWRVIKASGELIAHFPGGLDGHAGLLEREGFSIDASGKTPKVAGFKKSLVRFS